MEAYDRRSTVQRTWDVVDAVRGVAEERGVSMAQVALAWLVDRPAVTSVILGARTTEQLEDNLGPPACTSTRPRSPLLDAASDPGPADYPYGAPASTSAAVRSTRRSGWRRRPDRELEAPGGTAQSSGTTPSSRR